MIDGKRVVALIPLRGGSKSIPKKNIKNIAGKPLCAWTLEAASQVNEIDEICVSTDDEEITDVVRGLGLGVRVIERPAELATDEASTESVMLHLADNVSFNVLITLQATSPLTTAEDIKRALEIYFSRELDSLLTGVRCKRFFWNDECEPINYDYRERPRRQEFKGWIMENGAFYITDHETLVNSKCRLGGKIGIYEMSQETAYEIDEPQDWEIVENLLIRRKRENLYKELKEKIAKIKLLVVDVDGTLTDGGMYYSENGEMLKKFNTRDAKGLELLRGYGVKVVLMTNENSEIVMARARKLGLDEDTYLGVKDKLPYLKELCKEMRINLSDVAYIGDDVNDLKCLTSVGFSACPSDAIKEVTEAVDYVCDNKSGGGAVREFADMIR